MRTPQKLLRLNESHSIRSLYFVSAQLTPNARFRIFGAQIEFKEAQWFLFGRINLMVHKIEFVSAQKIFVAIRHWLTASKSIAKHKLNYWFFLCRYFFFFIKTSRITNLNLCIRSLVHKVVSKYYEILTTICFCCYSLVNVDSIV